MKYEHQLINAINNVLSLQHTQLLIFNFVLICFCHFHVTKLFVSFVCISLRTKFSRTCHSFSELNGLNSTKIGKDIEQSSVLHKFALYFI